MSQVIAGLYEIREQIGAGGGGIVYLGRHIRLEKDVVLKADKRRLSTGKESLRREVDMLKNLSHTYIPQVYDFVEENGVVYTVMDYIEGESFDKILARQGKLPQAQVIKWACQMLEALCYLHGQPPYGILHGDIKPANIMLRPDGNICLIDYNIALALGEDGAVKVGFSRGYASPEHYGADYVVNSRASSGRKTTGFRTKETEDPDRTLVLGKTEVQKTVMLDIRSDIYSLGATLYHMLSGKRPAQDAREVEPLGEEDCSPAVADIVRKAIAPLPDMRYQTAEEMLYAFQRLYENDPRTVRHRRRERMAALVLAGLFLSGGVSTFIGLNQLKQRQNALALSEYSANALAQGDVMGAIELALQAIPEEKSILDAPVTAQAQKALTDALGVYDLSDGYKALDILELPAAPFDVVLSPQGTRLAAIYAYEAAVYDTDTGQRMAVLPMQPSALADVVFADENTIIYAGEQGVASYDLAEQEINWTGGAGTILSLSADGSRLAAMDRKEDYATIYRVLDGVKIAECVFDGRYLQIPANDIFADARDRVFTLNRDGSILAVSFEHGGLMLCDVENMTDSISIYDTSDFERFAGGFCGQYFAFTADRSGQSVFGLLDVDKKEYLGGYESQDAYLLQTDEQGIYLANMNLLADFDPVTKTDRELAYTNSANITGFAVGKNHVLVSTDDQCASFYDRNADLISALQCQENCDFVALAGDYAALADRNEPTVRLLKTERQKDTLLMTYDPGLEHDEARISIDSQTAMLFNYKQFAVYDRTGRQIVQVDLPDADQIYDQQFIRTAEDSWLEVTWYDGTVRCYDAVTGLVTAERKSDEPDRELYEEFYTEQYRIVSPLHSAAEVYDAKSGELVTVLGQDSYLTYVTQLQDYLLTEYVSAAGERYGLLLNQDFETLAYLPGLCDVTEEKLIFDYGSGELRQCPLYSLRELVDMGEIYLSEQ